MNIMPMLVRLQGALGRDDLINQIILIPQSAADRKSDQTVNLVVGYDSSPKSQIALDLTLWIAYQTRIAASRPVTVQVVYVVEPQPNQPDQDSSRAQQSWSLPTLNLGQPTPELVGTRSLFDVRDVRSKLPQASSSVSTPVLSTRRTTSQSSQTAVAPSDAAILSQADEFEAADRILWQARCLADEWRGSLKTHLRFGSVADELKQVVEAEKATLLVVGCETTEDKLIRTLGPKFPCPVLGIPPEPDESQA